MHSAGAGQLSVTCPWQSITCVLSALHVVGQAQTPVPQEKSPSQSVPAQHGCPSSPHWHELPMHARKDSHENPQQGSSFAPQWMHTPDSQTLVASPH